MNATGMELYLTTALISILPIGAIIFSILTFHYTGVSFLHWISAIVWFVCGYFFMRQAFVYNIMYYQIIAIVSGVLGLVMVFAPFFLSAKHEDTLADSDDPMDKYMKQVTKHQERVDKVVSLRSRHRSNRVSTRGSDGHPLV